MKLEGNKVLVTGAFKGRSGAEVREALKALGARIVDAVAPDVAVVFAGEGAGREVDSAMELGVRVCDADALDAVLSGGELPSAVVHYDEPFFEAAPDEVSWGELPPPVDPADIPQAPPRGGARERASAGGGASGGAAGQFEKGSRVKIIGGLEGVGVVGTIFWWGESKYGDGMRAGVSGPGDTTYWVDEENLGWPEDEIDEETLEAAKEASRFKRGDRVRVVSGRDSGAVGTIFWWGESKFGDGMRAGIELDGGADKVWADASDLELAEGDDGEDDIPDDAIPF